MDGAGEVVKLIVTLNQQLRGDVISALDVWAQENEKECAPAIQEWDREPKV